MYAEYAGAYPPFPFPDSAQGVITQDSRDDGRAVRWRAGG